MSKTITLFLTTTPYTFQNTETALRVAEAALAKGHRVELFASGDGVHNFTSGQRASSVPNAEKRFGELISKGLRVELCGTCLRFRGIVGEQQMPGTAPSSMKTLFEMVSATDAFLSLGF